MHYGIIAAGEGSRLAQEGVERPKPLVRLCGKPMIGRLIDIFMNCGAESISVIVNERMTDVREYVERLASELSVPLRLVVKSTPSSMHSFHELSRVMGREGRFVLTTVDTVFRPDDFAAYVRAFGSSPAEVDSLMAVTPWIDDEKPLYVAVDADMKVTAFMDGPAPGVKYVSGGVYGLNAHAFDVLEDCVRRGESRMRNFQRALVRDGLEVRACVIDKIIDVDHAADIAEAEEFLGCGADVKQSGN